MPKIDKVKLKPIKTFFPRIKSSEVKKKTKLASKTKPVQVPAKPRSVHSKENTLKYFECVLDQIASPLNERVKITSISHQCKHNKDKVAWVKAEKKQELVKQVAQDYLSFGQSLGSLIHANIVSKDCKCK